MTDQKILAHDYDNHLDNEHHLLVSKSQYISSIMDLYAAGKMEFKHFKKELDSYLPTQKNEN